LKLHALNITKKSMVEVDTNVILRFLLPHQPELALKSQMIIRNAEVIFVSIVVFLELVHVLESVYEFERKQIWEYLQLLNDEKFNLENGLLLNLALNFFLTSTKLSFGDCYLKASLLQNQHPIATFDKELTAELEKYNDFHFGGTIDLSFNS
jgi:predicted nucleic-acid-binding protein